MRVRTAMVIHYVHDMKRAKEFYTNVFHVEALTETDGWTEFRFGPIVLALHSLPAGRESTLPHAGLAIGVDNVQEVHEDIQRHGGRVVEIREAHGHVPEVRCYEDSEGNGFELGQG